MVDWLQFYGLPKLYFGTKVEGFESRFKKVEQGGAW